MDQILNLQLLKRHQILMLYLVEWKKTGENINEWKILLSL